MLLHWAAPTGWTVKSRSGFEIKMDRTMKYRARPISISPGLLAMPELKVEIDVIVTT